MPKRKRILVVDDEAGIRGLLFSILTEKGYRVSLAKDGRDALAQLKRDRFDLLITDINMPRLDGTQLLKRIKSEGRKVKIIVITGDPFDPSDFEEEIPPVLTRLRKPFHINRFLEVVSQALATSKKRRQSSCRGSVRKKVINAI